MFIIHKNYINILATSFQSTVPKLLGSLHPGFPEITIKSLKQKKVRMGQQNRLVLSLRAIALVALTVQNTDNVSTEWDNSMVGGLKTVSSLFPGCDFQFIFFQGDVTNYFSHHTLKRFHAIVRSLGSNV